MEAGALNNLLISLQGSGPVREGRAEAEGKGRSAKADVFGLRSSGEQRPTSWRKAGKDAAPPPGCPPHTNARTRRVFQSLITHHVHSHSVTALDTGAHTEDQICRHPNKGSVTKVPPRVAPMWSPSLPLASPTWCSKKNPGCNWGSLSGRSKHHVPLPRDPAPTHPSRSHLSRTGAAGQTWEDKDLIPAWA